MTYRILDNKMGVILTRAAALHRPPVAVNNVFNITFEGAPRGSVAVFTCGGVIFYREIVNEVCSVSLADFEGEVAVTVALFTDKVPAERWVCESFIVSHMDNGNVLVIPSDMDLKQEVFDLRLENEKIHAEFRRLESMIGSLCKRLEQIMEGYNIT